MGRQGTGRPFVNESGGLVGREKKKSRRAISLCDTDGKGRGIRLSFHEKMDRLIHRIGIGIGFA